VAVLRIGFASCVFFFEAGDGIRDRNVTGVQTCALPISFLLLAAAALKICCTRKIFEATQATIILPLRYSKFSLIKSYIARSLTVSLGFSALADSLNKASTPSRPISVNLA